MHILQNETYQLVTLTLSFYYAPPLLFLPLLNLTLFM